MKFYTPSSGKKSVVVPKVLQFQRQSHAFTYLEENRKECRLPFTEIFEGYDCELPNEKIKSKPKLQCGENIVVTVKRARRQVVHFRDTGYKIMSDAWYVNDRSKDEKEKRLRIVKIAAAIIAEDVGSQMYEVHQYPTPNELLTDFDSPIPDTLSYLGKTISIMNKRGYIRKWENKSTAI